MRILVTGATGFVGGAISRGLSERGYDVLNATRQTVVADSTWTSLAADSDWVSVIREVDVIVHTAGATPANLLANPDVEYRESVDWTRRLAQAVRECPGVAVVHIGSLASTGGRVRLSGGVVDDSWESAPEIAYGEAKLASEKVLAEELRADHLVVHLRAPLIYGEDAGGSWRKLLSLIQSPFPLPFGGVRNRRSYLGVENLTDAVHAVISCQESSDLSGVYHIADPDPVSLSRICGELRKALGKSPALFAFPTPVINGVLSCLGKQELAAALLGDLEIDSSRFRARFGWNPPKGTIEGMVGSLSLRSDRESS